MWTLIKIASIILMFLLNCSSWLIVNFNKILFHKTVVLCLQSQLVDALWTFFKSLQLKLPIHVHDCRTWRAADHNNRRFPNLSQFQHFLKSYNITKISVKYYGSSISDKDQVLVIVWAGAEVDPSGCSHISVHPLQDKKLSGETIKTILLTLIWSVFVKIYTKIEG